MPLPVDSDRLASLFERATALDDRRRRSEFVAAETADDPALRAELESLILAHDSAGDFLEEPAVAEAAALIPDLRGSNPVGQSIGSWRVESLIDAGGMGSVYRATRIEADFTQIGALKLVRVGFETDALVQRFARERQLLASAEHPHIARLLDGGTTAEGLPWLAMEYVDGLPIDAYADRHRLTLQQRLDLFDQLADAIGYLHQNLIIHRDIKRSNVLVDANGHVRVLDFGIANLLDETGGQEEALAERRLSLAAAAPEQVRGEAARTATDIYALGVLLYRLLTGVPPYRITNELSATQIEELICERVPSPASLALAASEDASAHAERCRSSSQRLVGGLSGDLDAILAKTLHKDPARRYGSVAELRADIQRHRENRPILARPDSAAYRTRKFVRRHWRGLAATAVTMAALAVGLMAALWQADEARHQRDRAEAMNAFMQEVLAEADPYEGDVDKTVRQALAEAGALLDSRFAEQPLLESSLRTSVGAVQITLLDLDAGESNLNRALALTEDRLPPEHIDRLRVEANLAWLANERENYTQSLQRYERILDRLSDEHDPDFRAIVHNDFGLVLNHVERYADALPHFQTAMRLAPDAADRVATLVNLGYAADGLGRLEEAKAHYQDAIDALRSRGEAGVTADLAHALNNYGNILSQQDRDDEALPYYLESLDVRYRVFGERSNSVAAQHLNVGRLLLDMQRPREALPHLATAAELLPLYRAETSVYTLVARASHARAVLLTNPDGPSRQQALQTLETTLGHMQAEDAIRASRFAEQTAQWLKAGAAAPDSP